MSVSEHGLRDYIEVFHSVLRETAEQYLPSTLRNNLVHTSLLPARIIGYVSTQYGAAIEYQPAEETVIEVRRGSARVEDLLLEAPKSLRKQIVGLIVTGMDWRFIESEVRDLYPFRLKGETASLMIDRSLFQMTGRWRREIHFAEVFGSRKKEDWTTDKAVIKAKDEVLVALSELKRVEATDVTLSEYLATKKKNTVLVLGDYDDEGMERLLNIQCALQQLGYEPLLVKDVPDSFFYDVGQKVTALGSIARFVVIDDTSKSGHLYEVRICEDNNWVTVLLRAGGRGASWMTAGASYKSNVVLEQAYTPSSPGAAVAEASNWAEAKLKELQRLFNSTYPWRNID